MVLVVIGDCPGFVALPGVVASQRPAPIARLCRIIYTRYSRRKQDAPKIFCLCLATTGGVSRKADERAGQSVCESAPSPAGFGHAGRPARDLADCGSAASGHQGRATGPADRPPAQMTAGRMTGPIGPTRRWDAQRRSPPAHVSRPVVAFVTSL
jgi:hypothetical protein